MSEHLTEQEIDLYRHRSIVQADRGRIHAHLNTCESCLKRALDPAYSNVALNALTEAFLPTVDEEPFHLSRAELKKYISGSIDEADRIVCESHLDICAECEREARELSAAAAAVVVASQPASPSSLAWLKLKAGSFKELFHARERPPAPWGTPARVMGMIALTVGLLLASLFWYQSRKANAPDQTAQNGARTAQSPSAERSQNNNVPEVNQGEERAAVNQNGNDRQVEAGVPPTTENPPEKGAGSPEVVSLKDNDREISLDGQGNLVGLERVAPSTQRAVRAVLGGESLSRPQGLDELTSPSISLMGQPAAAGNQFKLLGPLGLVTRSDRPTLRWQPLAGASSYKVSVFDSDFNRVTGSEQQTASAWRVPNGLRRGRIYSWEVVAIKDGQEVRAPVAPAPRAQFKILEAEGYEELLSLERQRPSSHLALGVTYARYGLLPEAEQEFQILLKENPRSSVARNLLRTIQSWKQR